MRHFTRRGDPARARARLVVCGASVLLIVLTGCGGKDPSASPPIDAGQDPAAENVTATAGAASTTTTQITSPAARPGCGKYCKQASFPAADDDDGYPCPESGCLPCPSAGCIALLTTTGASARGGIFTVTMQCKLSSTCQGAFLLCAPSALCGDTPTDLSVGSGGRLGASDFTIPPNRTADVPIALTEMGNQLAGQPGGFRAAFLINMQDYGHVQLDRRPEPSFVLTTTDKPPALPRGATVGCGGTVFAGPDTSCPFAQNVEQAYRPGPNPDRQVDVKAISPVTGQTYVMHCSGSSPHVCRSDAGASVYFY